MREKNAIIICALICATMVICGVLFWPTFYRYDKTQSKLVRINRITGYTEVLSGSSWEPVAKKEPFIVNDYISQLKVIPREEIAKIEPKGVFDGKGRYNFKVYNGSEWTIKIIKLSIGLNDGNGKNIWRRIYKTTADIQPFSIGSCSIELMDYVPFNDTGLYLFQELEGELARRRLSKDSPEESTSKEMKGHWGPPINKSDIRVPEVRLEGAFGYKSE